MELFCVWCQVSATYLHRREIQRVHNNWWWMLSFEPFAHFCCVGKITILKYASASPKVGSILLRCDVGGWEDVSSFATLLFKLETLIWSGRGVSLHPFKNFTFIYTDNYLWIEWVRHLRPMLFLLLSLLLPLVHDTFSVSLRWGCYATHPSFPDKWSHSIQLLLTACQSQIKMAFVQWIRSKRIFLLLKFLTMERASFG